MTLFCLELLFAAEDILWQWICVPLLVVLGIWLTFLSRGIQLRGFPIAFRRFREYISLKERCHEHGAVHPLKAFFASVGGCVGIGNIVAVLTAVQIGGPGALFWLWITALIGMLVKYSEVYLGIRYRVGSLEEGFSGGPMYVLSHLFSSSFMPCAAALILCIYGVEVYQFNIIVHSISQNASISPLFIFFPLLALVFFAGTGGVRRVGALSAWMIPLFIVIYMGMGIWILLNNLSALPGAIAEVFFSAFSSHAAIGGFAGASLAQAISQGVRRACYTGDIGVGYASVIHSETQIARAEHQASLVFVEIFIDTFLICTTSIAIVLVTGIWHEPIPTHFMIQRALGEYFPYMHFFMPFFLFLLGYSTINAYFCAGLKSAQYLSPRWGRRLFELYAILCLSLFTFIGLDAAQSLMTLAGGLLLVLNCTAIFLLRREISWEISGSETAERNSVHRAES